MKRSFTLLAALVLLTTMSFAQSQQRRGMGDRQKMVEARTEKLDRGERFAKALELTDEQKTKIEAIHFESMKSMKTVKNTIGEKQARLKSLSTVENPDNKAIVKAASEIGDLKTKMFVNQVQTKQQVRALLDEKQKMKFDQMGDKMRQGKGKGRGNGQGRPNHMKRG